MIATTNGFMVNVPQGPRGCDGSDRLLRPLSQPQVSIEAAVSDRFDMYFSSCGTGQELAAGSPSAPWQKTNGGTEICVTPICYAAWPTE